MLFYRIILNAVWFHLIFLYWINEKYIFSLKILNLWHNNNAINESIFYDFSNISKESLWLEPSFDGCIICIYYVCVLFNRSKALVTNCVCTIFARVCCSIYIILYSSNCNYVIFCTHTTTHLQCLVFAAVV